MLEPPPDTNPLPLGLGEGDVVAGRYRIERVVGRGGMGVVVAAHHLELEGRVAIKFLSPNALSDPEAVARFDREIRAAARLKSEHVARVHDAGKLPDGSRFMVLEFLDGEDLAARLRRTGPLEPTLAIRYLLQACSAVLEAHGLGIVHRDLKPANLFVILRADGSESVKVLDFGVMKRLPGSAVTAEPQPTEPGTIIGTPLYTSPEQLRGSATVDARSDIWSLGVTLYELISGVAPFSGKTYAQIIANVLEADPVPLRELCPNCPAVLDAVLERCLKKVPTERYESVADLAFALSEAVELDAEQQGLLERLARHKQVSSPFASQSALVTPIASQRNGRLLMDLAPSRPTHSRQQRRRLLFVGGIAVATAVVVVGLGVPYLPQFGAPTPQVTQPDAHPALPSAVAPYTGGATALPTVGPVATEVPSAHPTEPTTSAEQRSTKSPVSRTARSPLPRAAVLPSATTAPTAAPQAQKRNPLLVRPK